MGAVEERLGIAQGIRVDQHFVAVKAKPSAVEILWPINTVGVKSAGFEALDIDVPKEESLVDAGLELDDLEWLDVVVLVEEKQFDSRGISGEDREIHSLLIDRSSEWVSPAGLRLERSQGIRLLNIGFSLGYGDEGWHGNLSGKNGNGRLVARCSTHHRITGTTTFRFMYMNHGA
jgi:hypothetical protein